MSLCMESRVGFDVLSPRTIFIFSEMSFAKNKSH